MEKVEIIYKKVKELKLNNKNPRKNDGAVDTVALSIEKYGFKNPLIIDENNVVWCGNTRLKASKKLKLDEVPCIVVKDLTPEKLREYALIDNKSNEIAEWDFELLKEEIEELDLNEFDLDWGVDEKEKIERNDISDKLTENYEVIIKCEDEAQQELIYNEMIERGLICTLSTL